MGFYVVMQCFEFFKSLGIKRHLRLFTIFATQLFYL